MKDVYLFMLLLLAISIACKEEDSSLDFGTRVSAISLYNPFDLDHPLDYVGRMSAGLLSTDFDTLDWQGDHIDIMERLDTADQAFLMMALAGMEYYPVGTHEEEDLDAVLKSVVEHGNPDGDTSQDTGLNLRHSIKKTGLGFRADIVRVNDRPHYIISVRGTQVKQPTFVQTFANILADLSASGLKVDAVPADVTLESLDDFLAFRDSLKNAFSTQFYQDSAMAHAGIFLAATTLEKDIADVMAAELDQEFPNAKTCVWITGHSLGGGMAPLIAYRLVQSASWNTRARICGVYTYGAPRVANHELVSRYNNKIQAPISDGDNLDLGSVTFRYQLKDDPIPHLPPNLPPEDCAKLSEKVSELVAELLMAVVRAYAPEFQSIDKTDLTAEGESDNLNEREALVAGILFGAGNFLENVYEIMDEQGVIEQIQGESYQLAKGRVSEFLDGFRSVQHVGHTRWIDRLPSGEYSMATGSSTQEHHLEWMMSFVESFRSAACADAREGSKENTKVQAANALGFHRTPFYTSVLLMHTNHGGADGRFTYADSDVQDRLGVGISYDDLDEFQKRLSNMYDADKKTFLGCH